AFTDIVDSSTLEDIPMILQRFATRAWWPFLSFPAVPEAEGSRGEWAAPSDQTLPTVGRPPAFPLDSRERKRSHDRTLAAQRKGVRSLQSPRGLRPSGRHLPEAVLAVDRPGPVGLEGHLRRLAAIRAGDVVHLPGPSVEPSSAATAASVSI